MPENYCFYSFIKYLQKNPVSVYKRKVIFNVKVLHFSIGIINGIVVAFQQNYVPVIKFLFEKFYNFIEIVFFLPFISKRMLDISYKNYFLYFLLFLFYFLKYFF